MIAPNARSLRILALAAVSAVALAACGGGSSSSTTAVATPPPPATTESKFGVGFATAFDALGNTEPAVPAANAIIPLSLTTEPIPLS